MIHALLLTAVLLFAGQAFGQAADTTGEAPRAGEIALSPTRFELPMAPGEEQTVVINVISGGAPSSRKVRLLSTLGDWTLNERGDITFGKAGSLPGSAASWMTYSPVELVVQGGQTHSIRVTIAVPEDATPGDHLGVLFVQERPTDNKLKKNQKQLVFNFRLAAIFYVMVTPLKARGELAALNTKWEGTELIMTSELKNLGNTRLRPFESFQLLDAAGKVVLDQPAAQRGPILAGANAIVTHRVAEGLAAGEYSLRYRVDFKDGGKVLEGRSKVVIPEPAPAAAQPAPAAAQPAKAAPATAPKKSPQRKDP